MSEYFLPPMIFDEIAEYAKVNHLDELLKITQKHNDGEISLARWEVDMLLNVAKVWQLNAELKYPFWDSEHPNYDPAHEDAFMDEQEDKWAKIAMTLPVR